MLRRAGERARVRELWRVGEPYEDELAHTVRIRSTARRRPAAEPAGAASPPAVVPAERGVSPVRRPRLLPDIGAGLAADLALSLSVPDVGALVGVAGGVLTWFAARGVRGAVSGRRRLRAVPLEADLPALAYALADGLHEAGLTPRGASAVKVSPDGTGAYRVQLAGVPAAASAVFASALDELVSPVGSPRYLLPRYVVAARGLAAGHRLLRGRAPANDVVYHAVPSVLGENRRRVNAFAAAWTRWVSTATPVFTRTPEGEALLSAQTGTSPMNAAAALRATWV
jgi:hypothetical protein